MKRSNKGKELASIIKQAEAASVQKRSLKIEESVDMPIIEEKNSNILSTRRLLTNNILEAS